MGKKLSKLSLASRIMKKRKSRASGFDQTESNLRDGPAVQLAFES